MYLAWGEGEEKGCQRGKLNIIALRLQTSGEATSVHGGVLPTSLEGNHSSVEF